jgi:hypothetical protein
VLILRVWCAVVAGAVDREGAVASVGRWRHDRFAEVGTVDRPGRVDGGGVRLGADAVPEHRRGDGVHATDRHAMRGPGAGAAPQDEPCGLPTGRRAPFLHRERRRALSATLPARSPEARSEAPPPPTPTLLDRFLLSCRPRCKIVVSLHSYVN